MAAWSWFNMVKNGWWCWFFKQWWIDMTRTVSWPWDHWCIWPSALGSQEMPIAIYHQTLAEEEFEQLIFSNFPTCQFSPVTDVPPKNLFPTKTIFVWEVAPFIDFHFGDWIFMSHGSVISRFWSIISHLWRYHRLNIAIHYPHSGGLLSFCRPHDVWSAQRPTRSTWFSAVGIPRIWPTRHVAIISLSPITLGN